MQLLPPWRQSAGRNQRVRVFPVLAESWRRLQKPRATRIASGGFVGHYADRGCRTKLGRDWSFDVNSKFRLTPTGRRVVRISFAVCATLTFILLVLGVWGVAAVCRKLGGPDAFGRVWVFVPAITVFGMSPLVYLCARYWLAPALGRQLQRRGMAQAEPEAPQRLPPSPASDDAGSGGSEKGGGP